MIPVTNISTAARQLCDRLSENPTGIPVYVGWNGERVAVFSSTYKRPVLSLPHVKLVILPGTQFDEVEILLALAMAELVPALPRALARGAKRPANPDSHFWKRQSIARKDNGA